jgi:CheY-specific phosphatase CheX
MDAMSTQFRDSIVTALEEILDKMAFMVFEQSHSALPAADWAYTSEIAFSGSVSGVLRVFLTRATAEEFARNFIGIRAGDQLHDATLQDALREFANILMGRALAILAPAEHYELQLPMSYAGAGPAGASAPAFRIEGMLNEAEPCRIDVSLSGQAA